MIDNKRVEHLKVLVNKLMNDKNGDEISLHLVSVGLIHLQNAISVLEAKTPISPIEINSLDKIITDYEDIVKDHFGLDG